MKFIAKTAVAIAKLYVAFAVANEIAYLGYKVRELEAEINKLKGAAEG